MNSTEHNVAWYLYNATGLWVHECVTLWVRDCVSAWLRECVTTWLRDCVIAWLRDCVTACVRECVTAWLRDCVTARVRDCVTRRRKSCNRWDRPSEVPGCYDNLLASREVISFHFTHTQHQWFSSVAIKPRPKATFARPPFRYSSHYSHISGNPILYSSSKHHI